MTICGACRDGKGLDFEFNMAFQPILDFDAGRVWGYEALVRGPRGEGAAEVLAQVNDGNRYTFDQACRVKAIQAAKARFDRPDLYLSINFLPNAVYEPRACIRATLAAAKAADFPTSNIMFEFVESEAIADSQHVKTIIDAYKEMGFLVAIDDFGAGYTGFKPLVELRIDVIKLDMELIRDIGACPPKRAIVRGLSVMASDLGARLLAEGVETKAEFEVLRELGLSLFQGFLFGRPTLAALDSGEIWARAA